MIGRSLATLGWIGLSACSPEPRSAAYFQARPEEAAKVVADCETGRSRGDVCLNAQAGQAAAAREARMDAYRKSF